MGKSIAVDFRRGERTAFLLKTCFVFLVITFLGKVSVPLPITPIPMALRPQLMILCAWIFGTRVTISAILLFCLGVWSDLPLLVSAGSAGKNLFGPTFGYVFSYFFVAVVAPKMRTKDWGALGSFLLLSIVIEILGALGLSLFVGLTKGFTLGFFPFVIGDAVKAVSFAGGYRLFTKSCGR